MADEIVLVDKACEGYRLPAEHRRAILSQVRAGGNLGTAVRATPCIEKQRQQFIEMHGDAFGLDADN